MKKLISACLSVFAAYALNADICDKKGDSVAQEVRCGSETLDVLFLGDSISDKRHVGCTTNYWGVLADKFRFTPHVYAVNGAQMSRLPSQAKAYSATGACEPDVIFVFAGSNDYNADVPLGEWYRFSTVTVDRNGRAVAVKKRSFIFDESTFRGRINILMSHLKETYPRAKTVVLTPVHRGYAWFGPKNVQPDESHSNGIGLFIDDYVNVVKEAGGIWSVKVVDLFADSGLLPNCRSHDAFIHNVRSDRLHPSDEGHRMIAAAIELAVGAWLKGGPARR